MSFVARLQRAREILEQQGRLSTRALERELGMGGEQLDELIEELVDVQQVALREGKILVWRSSAAPNHLAGTMPRFSAAGDAVARKVVTIVFADLVGSTALHERLDAESAGALMERYYQALRAVVAAHGGTVVKVLGDGVMAAFGIPRVAEDDALRAVRAAVAMQHAVGELARERNATAGDLGLRVAVNTGEVVVNAANDDVVGDPVNVAARLQQEARNGDVVIGESTRRLVGALVTLAPLGHVALKGRMETVAAYRVASLERPAGTSAVAFVGRDDELRRLAAVYDAAVAAPAARLAVILGSPGLGKSRLLDEFTRRLGGAAVLTTQCEAAGGTTFAPLARALRPLLRVDDAGGGDDLRPAIDAVVAGDDSERGRIAAGIGALLAGTPAPPEETFFVVRRLLTGLAAARPVVLAIDDLQWAEPLLLDLIEHLVQWSTGVPLLMLAAARPELRDARSSLAAAGRVVTDVVTLSGLDAAAATRLAASVIGADALPAAIAGRVLAASEGNPLFLAELVRMLVDDGALKREGGRWIAGVDLAALEMPPTIHALLAARIERLRAEDRLVLERAAIIGRQFSRAAVANLLPREVAGDLDTRLEALRRSELIEPDAAWFLGEPALRFHHGLTRDAAYRRVLKGTRVELHERVADWIERRVGEAVEHDETIGWHLEQAHRHSSELGPLDAHGRALGERAARYLAAAGRRALARDDLPLAASLLGRALDRLDMADPARADLALDWCEALLAAGDVGPAAQALDELGRFTGGSERLRAWHTCLAGERAALTDPQSLHATADAVAAAAAELAAAGDGAGEAKAHSVHALALARLGKVGASEAALDKALAAARRAHDRRRANAVLASAPLAALWGPGPVTRASGRCLDVVRVLRITQGAPAVEAVALRCQAVLEALRGRADAARRMIASSRRMVEELGITQGLLETEAFAGLIELIGGDTATAERSLRAAYDGLRSHGLGIDAARAAGLLGRTLLAQGRAAEAEALSHEGEALAGDDLQAAITWRRVRAEALAQRGLCVEAVDLARVAVDIAAATDALLHHAEARLALAAALRGAGRSDEAEAEEKRAIELWEAKGATVLAERARRDAGRVVQVDRGPDDRAEPLVRRRVGANAATAHVERVEVAMAAGDIDALPLLLAEHCEVVDHTTGGARYGRTGQLAGWRSMLRAQGLTRRQEPLATLGDSLALCRFTLSANGVVGRDFDVGPYEADTVVMIAVDAQGRREGMETFPVDRMGDAIARVYERYAELLPDGPERTRAIATARSVAAMVGPFDLDRWSAAFAPDIEFADPRAVGLGSVHGAEALLSGVRALVELTEDFAIRTDDVLALQSDALLVRWTNFGTDRAGGAFERCLCQLFVFGVDGLLTRWEQFDGEREDEVLARFEELTGKPEPAHPARRQVRANAATANAARLDAAITARDVDALPTLYADDVTAVHHATGTTWDRQGSIFSLGSLLRARDPMSRHEPLATLDDSLALCSWSTSGSAFAGGKFDVGAYERHEIVLIEVDAQGRRRWIELSPTDRLGDAVARLYERYAETLPEGPERSRAAAMARFVSIFAGPFDVERFATVLGPAFESVDHRTLGSWSARGAQAFLRHLRSLLEVADDIVMPIDEILDLRPDALLVRRMHLGTDRRSGGTYERPFLVLYVLGTDGLLARLESFDPDRDDEALARFDELTGKPEPPPPREAAAGRPRRVRPNAASAHAARLDALLAARDADAIASTIADESEVIDHTTGTSFDREGLLGTWRAFFKAEDPAIAHEPLATLGDALALCHISTSASGFSGGKFDVGAYERVEIGLLEVDASGRRRRSEIFAAERLGDAIARLYERYAELLPDGPERRRVAASARAGAAYVGPLDLDHMLSAMASDVEYLDHRMVGFGSVHGGQGFRDVLRTLFEAAEGVANRVDDVLDLRSDALLLRVTNFGTDRAGGGAFERPFLMAYFFGADGLVTRLEQFDVGHEAEALARFDGLTAERVPARPVVRRVRANAATAHAALLDATVEAGDAAALPALFRDDVEHVHHPTRTSFGRQGVLSSLHSLLIARGPTFRHQPLATLGDSLALFRWSMSASGFAGRQFDVGPYERVEIDLVEVDAERRERRAEFFAADRLGDAIVRLYERYAELLPDGAARTRATATARTAAAALGPYDLDRYATGFAPAIEYADRRTLGLGSAQGAGAVLEVLGTMLEVADGVANRVDDVLDLRADALLLRWTNFGADRAGGGAYERPFLWLGVFGTEGLLTRIELFDTDRDAEALARFDELTRPSPAVPFENAATRWRDRFIDAWEAHDWGRVTAGFAPGFRMIDRRTMMHLELDRDAHLESLRLMFEMRSGYAVQSLATRGGRLELARVRWHFEGSDRYAGPSEVDCLQVGEVDEHGDRAALVVFDPDDLDAAYTELDERYAAGEAAPHAAAWRESLRFWRALAARDWEQLTEAFAPDFVLEDHRPLGLLTSLTRHEYVASVRALLDLRPDATLRLAHVLAVDDRGTLTVGLWIGGEPEGRFEIPVVNAAAFGPDGNARRWHFYDPDQLDEARACYHALRPDPLRIPPNAATRARDRFWEYIERRDWEAFGVLCAPIVWEDRRRLIRTTGNCDMVTANAKLISRAGTRVSRTLLSTQGDRLMLQRLVFTGPAEGRSFETETLDLIEVDAEGHIVALVEFDPDDRRAAGAEMLDRYARSDAARCIPAALFEGLRAVNAHDLDRIRATMPDDFVLNDHRRTGLGRLGREDYLASLAVLFEQAPDMATETLYTIAAERHGILVLARNFGKLREGGEFESVYVRIMQYRNGRLVGVEMFEPEDLAVARARFAELSQEHTRENPVAPSQPLG